MPTQKPTFSIVIPTLNEEKYLPHVLSDLAQQTFTDFEVIVVDGNSRDKTVALVKKSATQVALTLLTSSESNVAIQRNLGGQKARGQWLLFMDADTRIPPYFLEGIKYQIEKDKTIDLFTTLIAADKESRLTLLCARTMNMGMLLMEKTAKKYAPGAFLGVKQSVFSRITFNPDAKIGEDYDFVRIACSRGYRFKIFKDPIFVFSFRRLRKEGLLKLLSIEARFIYKDLTNQKAIDDNYGYVMLGGSYYDHASKPTQIKSMHQAMTLTKQQIGRLNEFLKKLS